MRKNTFCAALVIVILIFLSGCEVMLKQFQDTLTGTWKSKTKSTDVNDQYYDHYEVYVFNDDGSFSHSIVDENGDRIKLNDGKPKPDEKGSYELLYKIGMGEDLKYPYEIQLKYSTLPEGEKSVYTWNVAFLNVEYSSLGLSTPENPESSWMFDRLDTSSK